MPSIYNAINSFPRELIALGNSGMNGVNYAIDSIMNPIGHAVEFISTPVRNGLDPIMNRVNRVINAVDSIAEQLTQSIANKIEAFPESHPRAMHVIEPVLLTLLNFSNNHPYVSSALAKTILGITGLVQMVLVLHISLVFPSLAIPLQIFALLYPILTLSSVLVLYEIVKSELKQRCLDKSDDITNLAGALFNIDSASVSKLNAWAAEERVTGNSNWKDVRKKIVRFFLSRSSYLLDLDARELHSLPDIFDAPVFEKLDFLSLKNNNLRDLPPSIRHLQSLTRLDLSGNRTLEHLPEAVFQLPLSCRVDINNCNFSAAQLEFLRNRVNHPTYRGPRITYSYYLMSDEQRQHALQRCENWLRSRLRRSNESEPIASPVEQSLRDLYDISGRAYKELSHLTEIPSLNVWLRKLFHTADFRGQLRQIFANKVIDYLERAQEDSSYRAIFSATILDAVDSCGDRVTLSVLKLGVTYQLSVVDGSDMQRIHHLLTKGTWALDLLHGIAREKILSMRFVDEIEVYLAYPTKLKEELDLPIDVNDMLYFTFSDVTDEDLETAKNMVLATLNNEEEHLNFLISQPEWINTLKLNYRNQYRAIEEKRQRDSDAATDSNNLEKHVEIDLVYKQEIRNLTRQVIRSFNN